ncbi:DUF2752 domain-containing protein [Streptomyces sp. NRRL S-337]|uniref:DUF2752 domain-containing protein n=1 Tax=Streptomyces sp. NRRL S-337 TaxID=1463900 RepID=UPI0004CC2D1B|nr:DUF2752 domain-containing protein [Streptomyces sp. NRRL S-337]
MSDRAAGARPPAPPAAGLPRRLRAPLGTLTAALAAFGYVGAVDPNRPGHYPVCPLRHLTGVLCPACGGLRSAHALVHADLGAALAANALLVAACAAGAAFWAIWFGRAARGLRTAGPNPRAVHWWALGGLLLVFTAVRNLPFGSGLAP